MNAAYVSAIAALAGSAIGAIASFATTWLTQNTQERSQRQAQAMTRRERLYGDFIDEAARLYADALASNHPEPAQFVKLYALRGKLRLFAPDGIIDEADLILQRILGTYMRDNVDVLALADTDPRDLDILRAFTEACRDDLRS